MNSKQRRRLVRKTRDQLTAYRVARALQGFDPLWFDSRAYAHGVLGSYPPGERSAYMDYLYTLHVIAVAKDRRGRR